MGENIEYISIEERIVQLTIKNKLDREEVEIAFENTLILLKPSNLIANSLNDFVASPVLGTSITNLGMSMALGFLTKKLTIGNSNNPIKVAIGAVLQYGVTAIASRNSEKIKTVGMDIIHSLLNNIKKDKK